MTQCLLCLGNHVNCTYLFNDMQSLDSKYYHKYFTNVIVLERTVRCLWTVRFFVMFNMFEVRFWAKMWCSEVFEVRSCCYVTRLVLELTVWCSRTVRVFVMFDMFEVRFWAKMWCSESSMFGHSMFGVFEVRYFGVRSKTIPDPVWVQQNRKPKKIVCWYHHSSEILFRWQDCLNRTSLLW